MGLFIHLDEHAITLGNPIVHVKDEYREAFDEPYLIPYLTSELCVIDMLCAVTSMRDGYYRERLVLKGGHSVRNFVPLLDPRFSFDVDFNANAAAGYSYGKVDRLKRDLHKHASSRGCATRLEVTRDNSMLYFLMVDYRSQLRKIGLQIAEDPKIEINKTARIRDEPEASRMNTMFDLGALGVEPPEFLHQSAEEQLVNKLDVIGRPGRARNHLDAYDAFRICENNEVDWGKVKRLFAATSEKAGKRPREYAQECRRLLGLAAADPGRRKSFSAVLFRPEAVDIDAMFGAVDAYYGRL